MKPTLIALALLVAQPVFAETAPPKDDICATVEQAAYALVMARMNGLPLTSAMQMADESSVNDPATGAVLTVLVKGAYELPGYTDAEFQQQAAREFANTMTLQCFNEREPRD